MLQVLRSLGVSLHIVTNKRAYPTGRIIDHLGWRSLFDLIYSPDSFIPSLSNKSETLAKMIADTGMAVDRGVYVGDQREDAQAAEQNHFPFLLAAWGYGMCNHEIVTNKVDVMQVPDPRMIHRD